MLLVNELSDRSEDELDPSRLVERVAVAANDAAKRRQRLTTDAGTEIAIDLPRGTFLRHNAVLVDDGQRAIVVERTPEEVLRLRIANALPAGDRVAAALRLGHAFGNQHVPVEIADGEVRVPITTSREVAERTVRALGLTGIEIDFAEVRLAADRPLVGHGHP